MRTDPNKSSSFSESTAWNRQRYQHRLVVPDDTGLFKYRINSFSGNEANCFFLQHDDTFLDLTLLSGVDHLGDGRGFAVLDFDRDGWLDIALISTNAPRFQLYRNRMAEVFADNGFRRIKLVGAQRNGKAALGSSNRDGIGAKIWVTRESGSKTLLQHQMGQGNVAHNSSYIWLAQPAGNKAKSLMVEWPSGKTSQVSVDDTNDDIEISEPNSIKAL